MKVQSQTPRAKDLLQRELATRIQRNPSYSLRSFARSLGLSVTVLSLVMSGKRPLSKKALQQVCDQLMLDPNECSSLKEEQLRFRNKKSLSSATLPQMDFRQLSLDAFSVISDWYHLPILSLLDLPQAKWDRKWIATRLGLSVMEAQAAMERLERLELVEEVSPGKFKQSGQPIKFENTDSTASTRKYHHQLLAKALEALENEPKARRDYSSVTFAMNESEIPYALERIRSFRRELMSDLEQRSTPTDVYQLNVQIFPLTKKENL